MPPRLPDRSSAATSARRRRSRLVLLGLAVWLVTVAFSASAHALAEAADSEAAALAEAQEEYWSVVLPWHPKLVHVPIALCILMPPVTLGLMLAVRLGWMQRRAFLVAAGLQAALAGASLMALYTGHQDAVAVEGYASDFAMEAHDTRAHQFVYVALTTTALFGLLLYSERKRSLQRAAVAAVVAAVMAQGYAGYRVGDAGGRLVYVSSASDAHK